MLDGQAPVVVSSQLVNRQDGEDEYHVARHALGEAPIRARCARSTTASSNRACTATTTVGRPTTASCSATAAPTAA